MMAIRKDGLGEMYPDDMQVDKFLQSHTQTHFAVKKGNVFHSRVDVRNIFTDTRNGCRVVPGLHQEAAFLTDEDDVSKYPFYLRGYFGLNKKNKPITGIVAPEITTLLGNRFQLQKNQREVHLLLIQTTEDMDYMDVKYEAKIIANVLNGIGLTAGLVLAPGCIGTLV